MKKKPVYENCPCGLAQAYEACCGRYHAGLPTPTAEALMRSRYTAYVQGNEAYLLASWASNTRPSGLDLADDPVKWLGLTIVGREAGGETDRDGMVEFVARYKAGGRAMKLCERSRFIREEGWWRYLDGEIG